jgi:predicted DNA binding CopG/RHH family protein
MSKQLKPIPEFASGAHGEEQERAFWESPKNDSTEYVDWSKAKLVTFPKLRPSTETISLRMPEDVLNTIRNHARKLDVPYQSLIKLWCAEKVSELVHSPRTAPRGSRVLRP